MAGDQKRYDDARNLALATQLMTNVVQSQQRQIEGLAEIISMLLDQPEMMHDQREQLRSLLVEIKAPRLPEPEAKQSKAAVNLWVVQPEM